MGNSKRVTIKFADELLEWVDQKKDKKIFHNYQHAAEYCLMREYERDTQEND